MGRRIRSLSPRATHPRRAEPLALWPVRGGGARCTAAAWSWGEERSPVAQTRSQQRMPESKGGWPLGKKDVEASPHGSNQDCVESCVARKTRPWRRSHHGPVTRGNVSASKSDSMRRKERSSAKRWEDLRELRFDKIVFVAVHIVTTSRLLRALTVTVCAWLLWAPRERNGQ